MAFNMGERTYDYIEDDSYSEDEGNDTSSEDEIDIILHGTPEQRRKLQHLHHKQQGKIKSGQAETMHSDPDSSSEDEFEKEMNAELNQHVKFLEDLRNKSALENAHNQPSSSRTQTVGNEMAAGKNKDQAKEQEYYDEIYFDSDDEDEPANSQSSKKAKRSVISNDDLLYDPDMDDEDQRWVDRQRQSHRSKVAGKGKDGRKMKMPNSDALLDCPACMTTLCIDCQRHETYKHQYRAMFVMNCSVDTSETLQCPEQETKKKKKKKKKETSAEASSVINSGDGASNDLFNPVRCTECNTVVGVIDHDEVYHFFNVLASYT